MMKRTFLTWTFVLMIFAIFVLTSASAQPYSFKPGLLLTVNNNGDGTDVTPGDGLCATSAGICTLRAAIEESNTFFDDNNNVIVFDLPQPAVIDLTRGELVITQRLQIVGPGARRLTVRRSTQPSTPN